VTPEAASPRLKARSRLGIVFAVRNEGRWLDGLLTSLVRQAGREDVCCVAAVDGRSEDGSRAILERWTSELPVLRVLDNEARIAPVGFNIGIRECLAAGAEAILLVSGHSELEGGYLEEAQRILAGGRAEVVGCILDYPPAATAFERASQAFVESRLGRRMGSYTRLTDLRETEIATFPVIRREVFDRVGFFDETMIRNQDIEFTTRARAAGFRVATSPTLRCRYSPPASLRRLMRQMYGNGLWVGRRLSAHGLRHVAPALFFATLLGAGVLAVATKGRWIWPLSGLGAAYALVIAAASLSWLGKAGRGALWLPVVFLGAHAAYAAGTFHGLASRGPASGAER
jgi:succinoglycan biosynthesis protein ExoA